MSLEGVFDLSEISYSKFDLWLTHTLRSMDTISNSINDVLNNLHVRLAKQRM